MYYHASNKAGIKVLRPSISNHDKKYVYFSDKRENIIIYGSNPVEKYCKENGRQFSKYNWFAPYTFNLDGVFCYEEYFPNLLEEAYSNVSCYVYYVKNSNNIKSLGDIRNVFVSSEDVDVFSVEYIENILDELLRLNNEGKIKIIRYNELNDKRKEEIKSMIIKDYLNNLDDLPTKYYYENHFKFLNEYRKD